MYTYIYIYIYIYIHTYIHTFVFVDSRNLPQPVARYLLRRWTGNPPESLNGLTYNPLNLLW